MVLVTSTIRSNCDLVDPGTTYRKNHRNAIRNITVGLKKNGKRNCRNISQTLHNGAPEWSAGFSRHYRARALARATAKIELIESKAGLMSAFSFTNIPALSLSKRDSVQMPCAHFPIPKMFAMSFHGKCKRTWGERFEERIDTDLETP